MKRKSPTDMPPDFAISERVRKWAAAKGYGRLDEHLELFKLKAESNGYRYVNWDSALMVCIAADWFRLREKSTRPQGHQMSHPAGLEPKVGESMESWQRRLREVRH